MEGHIERRMIDEWVAKGIAKVGVARNKLATYGEVAGLSTWNEIVIERAGLSWRTTPSDPDSDDTNISMENWLRQSLAVGRHPFNIGYVMLPDAIGHLEAPEWPDVVFNADREVWGFTNEEIEDLIKSGAARFALDRRKIAVYRQAAGIDTWKGLSALSGVNVDTLQKLSQPTSNPTCKTWIRIALAIRVHPYAIAYVKLPGVTQSRLVQSQVIVEKTAYI